MSSYIYTTTTNDDFTFAELDANIIHLPEDENGNYVLVKTVDDIYSWKNVQDFSGDITSIPVQTTFNITDNTLLTNDQGYTFIVNFLIDDMIAYANTDKQQTDVYINNQYIESFKLNNTSCKQQRIFNSISKGKLELKNLFADIESIFIL